MTEPTPPHRAGSAGQAEAPAEPRYLVGRYRLDRVLGKGAMGKVWAAHDEALNRWVAIKEVDLPRGMPASEADQVAERAMREARAVASVSDPHVVTIYDLLTIGQAPAIVMELLEARSLAEILRVDGPVGEAAAATIGLAVASGLTAAHAAGVTHRDVKPGNVLLCRDGRVKLTDFGIARSLGEQTLTATGLLLGSPAYIAPEVAAGRPATAMADAWGLGALLYACVEGVPPFDRGDPFRTLAAVVQDPVPPHPGSGRLSRVIDGLLTKDPTARLTVGQAHHVLRHLDDDPAGTRLARFAVRDGEQAPLFGGRPVAGPAGPAIGPIGVDGTGAAAGHGATATAPGTSSSFPPRPVIRPAVSAPVLPPPPWAASGAAELPALPAAVEAEAGTRHRGGTDGVPQPARHRSARSNRVRLWIIGLLVALLAAAGGYFGVRAIAALARSTGAASVSAPSPGGPLALLSFGA